MGLWPGFGEEIPSTYYQSVIKTVIRDNEGGAGSLFCCVIAIIEFQLNIHLSSLLHFPRTLDWAQ